MKSSNWVTPEKSPPVRQVKPEPPRIPSPSPSCISAATTLLRPGRPPSPVPSCSTTVLFGGRERGQISIRPLSSILDPEDKMSTVSGVVPSDNQKLSHIPDLASVKSTNVAEFNEETNDWRLTMKNVGDRLKFIYENDDKYQDVIFEVEGSASKQQFKAHKLILRIASPTFDRLFQNNASSQTDCYTVQIKDVEPDIFKVLLKFIYTDEIDATGIDLLPLLQAAKLYGVRQLYMECVASLKACISDNVAVKLCEVAASYGDKSLLDVALDHIANKAFEIFPSEDFLKFSQDNVYRLLIRNDLRIDEITVFEAVLRWGGQKCVEQGLDKTSENLRKVTELLIPEIRFPLMQPIDFTLMVGPTYLLTDEEKLGVYQYFSVDESNRKKLPPIAFKSTPRLSKKTLDLESSSSSDYRDGSSASPEQVRTLPSMPDQSEGLDLTTTEAESETASNVSTYSSSRKKSRKYERSLSHSSGTSSTKRRKTEKEKPSHRESFEKTTNSVSYDDLFGDFEYNKNIVLKDTTISLNSFIMEMSRHNRRHEVESIKLENVTIQDWRKLEGYKVNFSRLKQFELNINIEIGESFKKYITDNSFSLQNYLFFSCKSSNWSLEKLWDSGIDVTVVINKHIMLRLSHENQHVTLNKFSGNSSLLKSLKDKFIKSLVYTHNKPFKDRNFPLSLHRLVVLKVVSSKSMSSFIQQFKHLKELTLVPRPDANEPNLRELTLGAEVLSKDKIKKLGLGFFNLHLERSIRFYNIVTLSLQGVTWESYFEEKFHFIFPKLQELFLFGPMKGSPKLLKNILRIENFRKLVNWNCDFRLADDDSVIKILVDSGISEPENRFILTRKSEKDRWEGSKNLQNFSEYLYTQFEYEFLYEDRDTWLRH